MGGSGDGGWAAGCRRAGYLASPAADSLSPSLVIVLHSRGPSACGYSSPTLQGRTGEQEDFAEDVLGHSVVRGLAYM